MSKCSSNPNLSLADGQGYMLDRIQAASSRLNLQFYLRKDAIKFNIHPSISIPKNGIIADVVTGTVMWLINAAHELPTAQLDRFDIHLSQAPPRQWLPSNATTRHWNFLKTLPDESIGKYNPVHARLPCYGGRARRSTPCPPEPAPNAQTGRIIPRRDDVDCPGISPKAIEFRHGSSIIGATAPGDAICQRQTHD